MRMSKIGSHENPYDVTGIIKSTNPEEQPKGICTDRDVGTWKARCIEDSYPMNYIFVRVEPQYQ